MIVDDGEVETVPAVHVTFTHIRLPFNEQFHHLGMSILGRNKQR